MRTLRAVAALGVAGLLLAAVACGSSQPPRPQASVPQPSPSLSPSSPPLPPTVTASVGSEVDQRAGQALAMVPQYYATLDKLNTDPLVSPNDVYTVATSPDAATAIKLLNEYRSAGYKQSGTTKVVSSRSTGVDLTFKREAKPPVFPLVQVTTCIDVTDVRVRDMAGKRVGPANRPDFYVEKLTITNPAYPSTTGWKVTNFSNAGVSSCA